MGLSEFDSASREGVSWNAGRKVGAKRSLKPRRLIWAIRFFLDQYGRVRDRPLFDLAIDSKLRGCDFVKIRISDVVCDRKIQTRAIVVQEKAGWPVQFELMDDARASLLTLSMSGSREWACPARTMALTLRGEPRHRLSIRRPGISAPSRFCLDIRRLKARLDTLGWMWKML